MAEKYAAEQVVEAVRGSGGLLTEVAARLKCSRRSVYRYRDRYASVREALEDERESTTDYAESALRAMILDPTHRNHAAAVIFALKTLGKARGYVERVEVERLVAEELEWMWARLEDRLSPAAFREVTAALAEPPIKGESFRD
jgi:AcrR family transcriptional regulator